MKGIFENFIDVSASDMVEEGIIDYGKTTIEQRALPDLRDGLKPAHRRILYAMYDKNIVPGKNLKKSAFVVGEVIGKYHPHSDMAIFNALVKLVQAKYPLVYGLGCWGDEYSSAAAPRYIDCRLSELALYLFEYLSIADFVDNYSGEFKEPLVLPSKIPVLLMNGSSGIAVGVSSCIPPHNLEELVNALEMLVKDPDTSLESLLEVIKGPDYNRLGGVLLSSKKDILEMYRKGEGVLRYRCQYKYFENNNLHFLEIFNFAPSFNRDAFLTFCDKLVKDNLLEYASDDSADGVFKLTVASYSSKVLKGHIVPALNTSIHYQFHVTERSLDKIDFRLTNLKDLMLDWLEYQREIRDSYYQSVLSKLKIEMLTAKLKLLATNKIEIVADCLKAEKPEEELSSVLNISVKAAGIILDFKLSSLTKTGKVKQRQKIADLKKEISFYKNKNLDEEIIKDLKGLSLFFTERKTLISEKAPFIKVSGLDMWIVYYKDTIKKIISHSKVKNFDHLCVVSNGFYLISEVGSCIHCKDKDIDKVQVYPDVFRFLSGDYSYLYALDNMGKCVLILLDKIKKKEFCILKTRGKLLEVKGFNDGDILILSNFKETVFIKAVDLETARLNTRGRDLDLVLDNVSLDVLSSEDILYQNGKISLENLDTSKKWYVIGDYNLTSGIEDNVSILNKEETLKLLESDNFKTIKKLR